MEQWRGEALKTATADGGIPQNTDKFEESHRKISATVNGKVYKAVFRPAIIYGAQENKLDVWSNENG